MGLDMYAYRISKLTERQTKLINGKSYEKSKELIPNINLFRSSNKDEMSLIENVMQFMTKVSLISNYINIDKIRDDFKIPLDASIYVQSFAPKRYSWIFGNDSGYKKTVSLTREKVHDEYTISINEDYYVCKMKEVDCWRKDYDLEYFIRQYMSEKQNVNVGNCGYYIMPQELMEIMVDNQNLKSSCLKCSQDKAIVYQESY